MRSLPSTSCPIDRPAHFLYRTEKLVRFIKSFASGHIIAVEYRPWVKNKQKLYFKYHYTSHRDICVTFLCSRVLFHTLTLL